MRHNDTSLLGEARLSVYYDKSQFTGGRYLRPFKTGIPLMELLCEVHTSQTGNAGFSFRAQNIKVEEFRWDGHQS